MNNYPTITNRKIKVAIVGCGRISKNHFESIDKNKKYLELVSICENNKKKLFKFQNFYNLKGYTDLTEMLKKEQLDLVILCTPSGLHAQQSILCAKYGVNVVTEKPMAIKLNDGKKMIKEFKKANVRLFVVLQNRKNKTLQLLKQAIVENRFGKIYLININVFWSRPQKYYDQAKWRGTQKYDGGALMNQASHYVDLLTWLIGPVDKVHFLTSRARKIEVEDTGALNIKWKNGAIGSLNVTMLTYPKNLEGSIVIIGEKGTVRIGGTAVNKIEHWEFEQIKPYDKNIKKANYQPKSVYGLGHPLYYKNVIETLLGKSSPDADGSEGLKSLEIIIAAYLSSKKNKIVKLPLKI